MEFKSKQNIFVSKYYPSQITKPITSLLCMASFHRQIYESICEINIINIIIFIGLYRWISENWRITIMKFHAQSAIAFGIFLDVGSRPIFKFNILFQYSVPSYAIHIWIQSRTDISYFAWHCIDYDFIKLLIFALHFWVISLQNWKSMSIFSFIVW